MSRVIVRRLRSCRLAQPIRLIRRRRLIAGRRIGQGLPRRLAGELRRLFLLAAEKRTKALEPQFGGEQLAAETRRRRLVAVVLARLLFLRAPAGGQLIRPQRILFALAFVTDIAVLFHGRLSPAALYVWIFRPSRIVGGNSITPFGRGQFTAGRNHQR